MIHIIIEVDALSESGKQPEIEADLLEGAARQTLACVGAASEAELSVVLSSDERLADLNRRYLGVDAPTDVLAFPSGEVDPDTGMPYLGDVLVSYPRALAQAATGGHSVEEELQLLVVHGVLHLLGYDHATPAEHERMWALQAEALTRLGSRIKGLSSS